VGHTLAVAGLAVIDRNLGTLRRMVSVANSAGTGSAESRDALGTLVSHIFPP
jgi:hypothetical protein